MEKRCRRIPITSYSLWHHEQWYVYAPLIRPAPQRAARGGKEGQEGDRAGQAGERPPMVDLARR